MRPRRTSAAREPRDRGRSGLLIALVVSALVVAAAPLRAAGLVDPLLRFRQLRTEHFIIYFHQGEERLAQRLASIVEDVRQQVGGSLGLSPPPLTHVILADQSELANGWATPVPRDTVFLNAAAPSGADFIGRTSDWLRLVFTHEYSHIVHLDRSGSWAWLVRGVFGRTAVAFPNLWLPQWQVEGLATWEESLLTGEGRRSAGDFREVARLAAIDGHPISIDRASGGLVGWPDGHAAYAAGVGFHEYLVDRFGQDSVGRLGRATSRRLPFLGTRAYRSVYGQSLGALWRDYERQLRERADEQAEKLTTVQKVTSIGYVVSGPRFSPADCPACADDIVYSVQTADDFPRLRAVHADGTGDRTLATRYLGSTTGLRGSTVIFDQQEVRRNVGVYSDLFALDRRSGDVRQLTADARLQDPDVSPDGRRLVAVRENGGQRDLVFVRSDAGIDATARIRDEQIAVLVSAADTQFSAPRWSPDGRRVAAERRRVGALPDIVVVNASGGEIEHVVGDANARIVTPAWRPDGDAIVAAADFDRGPFDLYEFPLSGSTARRLTRTRGALWPDVSRDGRTVVFAGYDPNGYDVYLTPYTASDDAPRVLTPAASSGDGIRPASSAPIPESGYTPWGTIAPTAWSPLVVADSDQTRIGAAVGGSDLLGRHAYGVNVTWLVDGPTPVRSDARSTPDWSASYGYARWRPTFFVAASRETLFRTAVEGAASREVEVMASQRELQAGVFLPIIHVRETTQMLASLVRTKSTYLLPDRDRDTLLVSSRLALAHDTTHRYGYSISREGGVDVGGTLELTRETLGSDAAATTATIDARAYVPGLALHHVLALRAAAGTSSGADVARQVFRLGAVGASPSVIDFGGDAVGLFRGPGFIASGRRIVTGNVDYRFPIAVVERGIGTWPLLVRSVHAAVFADVGRVSGTERDTGDWARAVGGELSADAVAGYALPFAVSVGASWSHDGRASRGAAIYARVGRAF